MGEQIKFYFDQNVAHPIAEGLRRRSVDVLTAQEANKCGITDEEQLAFARRESRVLFTHDKDFLKIYSAGQHHSGIVYIKQGASIGYIIRGLIMIYDALSSKNMENHVEFL